MIQRSSAFLCAATALAEKVLDMMKYGDQQYKESEDGQNKEEYELLEELERGQRRRSRGSWSALDDLGDSMRFHMLISASYRGPT